MENNIVKLVKFLLVAMLIAAGLPGAAAYGSDDKKPNIILIMSDDHAANAISSYGGRLAEVFKTPNIDRIAEDGMRLNAMYATNSICTPSRAAIMTGQYAHTNGVRTLDDVLDPAKDNLAKRLKAEGYQTAIIGKWHLKSEPSGFDYYNVLPGQGHYYDPKFKEKGGTWRNGKAGGKIISGYVTDIITDLSIQWIDKRHKDKPFFVMIHHKAPHGLWQPAKRHENLLKDITIPEPVSLFARGKHGPGDDVIVDGKRGQQFGSGISRRMEGRAMVTRMVRDDWPTGKLELESFDRKTVTSAAYQKYLKDYLRTLAAVDENVGKVLDYVDVNGLSNNTIIIYTSDQGMMLGEHDYYDKRWIYEESSQMPFLIKFPGVIPQASSSDNLFTNVDIAPTLIELAGGEVPESMQGKSFVSGLKDPGAKAGHDAIYYRYWLHMAHHTVPAHYGVRTKTHKLAFFYGLPLDANGAMPAPTQPYWELYDMVNDRAEMNNIYSAPTSIKLKARLKAQLLALKQVLGDTDESYPELMDVREKYWE